MGNSKQLEDGPKCQISIARETGEEMQFDSNSHVGPFREAVFPPLSKPIRQKQKIENSSTGTPTIKEACGPETPRGIRHSVTRAYTSSVIERSRNDTSRVKFEGFNIRSGLVPILQNIWSKHGNIVENSIICNGDLVAKALESLAKAVLILKDNSAESLDDDQANYLRSTLVDLRRMCFRVEWLAPCIEKAIELQKGKPSLSKLEELRQTKAKTEEMRSKLINDLGKLDREVKELDRERYSGNIQHDSLFGKSGFTETLGRELL